VALQGARIRHQLCLLLAKSVDREPSLRFGYDVMVVLAIPSGKRLHNYGKSTFLMGKSTINDDFQ